MAVTKVAWDYPRGPIEQADQKGGAWNVQFNISLSRAEKAIYSVLNTKLNLGEEGPEVAEVESSMVFDLVEFDELFPLDQESAQPLIEQQRQLTQMVSSIHLATSRGVVLGTLQGTPYNQMHIPLINPSQIIGDFEFPLKE